MTSSRGPPCAAKHQQTNASVATSVLESIQVMHAHLCPRKSRVWTTRTRWKLHRSHRSRSPMINAQVLVNCYPWIATTALLHSVCPGNSNLRPSTSTGFRLLTPEWVVSCQRLSGSYLLRTNERHHQAYDRHASMHIWTGLAVICDMCFNSISGSEYVADLW